MIGRLYRVLFSKYASRDLDRLEAQHEERVSKSNAKKLRRGIEKGARKLEESPRAKPILLATKMYLIPTHDDRFPDTDPVTGDPLDGSASPVRSELAFYLHDHLGNTRVTFRADSKPDIAIEYAADYYPFGKILREYRACNTPRYLSTHHERDQGTGYDNRGARLYDSEIGRFLGVDPIADQFTHVSTYNYAENEPIANIDLHGLQKVSIHLIGAVTSRQNGSSQRTPFAFSATVDQGQNNHTNVAGSVGPLGFAAEYNPRSEPDFSPAPGEAVNAEVRQKILEAELGTIGLPDIATVTGIESAAESLRGQVSDEKSSAENLGLQLGADALDVLASLVDSDQLRVAFGYDGSEGVGYNEEGEPYLRKLTGIVSLTVKDGTVTLILDDNTTLEYRAAATYTAESCQSCDDDD